ncbi:MAG: putative glycosyltransferase EpsE [Chloroflexi bacterium]|nr:putative glycosyltransferase EpsE [Chloroflexota bacterium]
MPTVSVLITCYNAERTLEETLASLAAQTLEDFEVIAVDDGSTDNTLAILKDWGERDARFSAFSKPHTGIISSANQGVTFCQSRYIARMDADDRAHPQRLALQVDYLNTHPDVAAVGSLVKGFPEEQVGKGFQLYYEWLNSLVTHEDICREIFVESPLPNPSVTIRKSWFERLGGYQEHGWPEDYDFWLRMYLAGARFAKIPRVLLEWREHPERVTHTDSRYSVKNFLRAKAHYLALGPLQGRDAVFIWGAGMTGRRLSKHLIREEKQPIVAFVDIDPKKIGRTRRGRPIIAREDLMDWWGRYENPVLLAAVRARYARPLIREKLVEFGLVEGEDWWAAA